MDYYQDCKAKNYLYIYIDDIVIYAALLEEHERKYNLLIERLQSWFKIAAR